VGYEGLQDVLFRSGFIQIVANFTVHSYLIFWMASLMTKIDIKGVGILKFEQTWLQVWDISPAMMAVIACISCIISVHIEVMPVALPIASDQAPPNHRENNQI
jgi:hypothetical protein